MAGLNILQSNHRKTASLLAWTISALAGKYGLERLGFLTLTFGDDVQDAKESQRRFKSLRSHVLNVEFLAWVRVFERQKRGRIHYHLLVVLSGDIRTGVDFKEFESGRYTSAGPLLRSQWAFWRDCAPKYGFGRTELLPVKSTSEGIARYVGKYISKHIDNRQEIDRGVRLVEISRAARVGSTRFAWATAGAWLWRRKLGLVADAIGIPSMEDMTETFGPRWAYWLQELIGQIQLLEYPSREHAEADGRDVPVVVPEEVGKLVFSSVDSGRLTVWQSRAVALARLTKMWDRERIREYAFGSAVALGHRPINAARIRRA